MAALLLEHEGRDQQHCAWCGAPAFRLLVVVPAIVRVVKGKAKVIEAGRSAWACSPCERRLERTKDPEAARKERAEQRKADKLLQERLF